MARSTLIASDSFAAASVSTYTWQTPTTAVTDAYATVNTLNQYPTVTPHGESAQTQSYDANGNLTGDGLLTLAYDPENRLMTATNGTLLQPAYAYDPLGRRQEKSGASVTTTYFLDDGSDDIAEYNSAGALTRRFVPGPAIDEPIALVPASGTTELLYTDHHGSIVATSNSGGNLIEGPFVYDSWGNCYSGTSQTTPCPTTAASIPFRFTGQYFDNETGCTYYRARMYCADSLHGGRFLQTDPVGYDDDLNLYSYVGNDPTDRTDPMGLYSCDGTMSGGQCGQFTQAQNSAKTQITGAIGSLKTLKADAAAGKLTAADKAVAGTVSKYLGAGAGTNGQILGKLIGAATNMLGVLNSSMPAGLATKQDTALMGNSSYALSNPGRLALFPSFFSSPRSGAADIQRSQTVAHESDHAGNGGVDLAYGSRASQWEAQRWGANVALQNPDNVTFSLGFERTDGWP